MREYRAVKLSETKHAEGIRLLIFVQFFVS